MKKLCHSGTYPAWMITTRYQAEANRQAVSVRTCDSIKMGHRRNIL